MFGDETEINRNVNKVKKTNIQETNGTEKKKSEKGDRKETWNTGGLHEHLYNIGQVLEHHATEKETSIRKNGLISETEAKNCITQEHTFTKISLTVPATQLG